MFINMFVDLDFDGAVKNFHFAKGVSLLVWVWLSEFHETRRGIEEGIKFTLQYEHVFSRSICRFPWRAIFYSWLETVDYLCSYIGRFHDLSVSWRSVCVEVWNTALQLVPNPRAA